MTMKPTPPTPSEGNSAEADTAEKLRAPYAELLAILRRDVDYGGHDGYGPDQIHQSAANAIETLIVALASQVGIANTERAQAERLAKASTAKPAQDGAGIEPLREAIIRWALQNDREDCAEAIFAMEKLALAAGRAEVDGEG